MQEEYTGADTRADIEKSEKPRSSKYWLAEIKAAGKREEGWRKKGKEVVKQFRDERDREAFGDHGDQKINIFWSNTEVLKAALFASMGKPDVRRRYVKPGRQQMVAKYVAILLENALSVSNDLGNDEYEVDRAVEDMLLPGRGQIWAELESEEGEDGYIASAKCSICHIGWEDYRQGPGNRWGDIPWVARGWSYTRDDLIDPANGFDKKHAEKVPLNYLVDGCDEKQANDEPELFKRARVWEIWDKNKKERIFVAEDYDWQLRADQDPYRLEHFFPCPRPLIGVATTNSAIPIPEYTLYQDQAEELNRVTIRIFKLIKMLKVAGVYDATAEDSEQLVNLQYADDGKMLPYKGVANLISQGGGLDKAFLFWPMAETIAALQQLYAQRDQLVQSIYEVTGISDIIRGATNPGETATAQRLKGQFGSMRMQKRQKEVQRFIRDIYRLKAELVAEHYPREQLEEMTGVLLPTEAEKQQAQQFLAMAKMQQQAQQQPPQPPQGPPQGQGQMPPPQGLPPPQGQPQPQGMAA
jgi:hypothetical protein